MVVVLSVRSHMEFVFSPMLKFIRVPMGMRKFSLMFEIFFFDLFQLFWELFRFPPYVRSVWIDLLHVNGPLKELIGAIFIRSVKCYIVFTRHMESQALYTWTTWNKTLST